MKYIERKKNDPRCKSIVYRVTKKQHKFLDDIAKERGITKSNLIDSYVIKCEKEFR